VASAIGALGRQAGRRPYFRPATHASTFGGIPFRVCRAASRGAETGNAVSCCAHVEQMGVLAAENWLADLVRSAAAQQLEG